MITIDRLEVLALKKLVLINHALAKQLRDPMAAREQKALVQVLNGITLRAELDNSSPQDTPASSSTELQPDAEHQT